MIGIVGEQTAAAANARDKGFKDAIAAEPGLQVVAEVNGKVEETTTLKVVTEMLMGNPEMSIVFSSTEPSALGAIMAIEQLGRDDVEVYAFVDKLGVQRIEENTILKAGAIQEPARLAQILVENAKAYLGGATVEAMVESPPLLVNSENAAEVVDLAY
ncbi:MAG: substrate-binding domain-containing protein [Paracoccaceae bacterium]